jgi:PAS domain S-box-containing protein
MQAPKPSSEPSQRWAWRTWPQRLLGPWWQRQSVAQQDRLMAVGPLISVLLFLAAITFAFWFLRSEEFEREKEAVKRNTEIVQQQIRLRMIENQEQLVRVAREMVAGSIKVSDFDVQARLFTAQRPELTHLIWMDAAHKVKSVYSPLASLTEGPVAAASAASSVASAPEADRPDSVAASAALPAEPEPLDKPSNLSAEASAAFINAQESRQTSYSSAYIDASGMGAVFQIHVPLLDRTRFQGTLVAQYSVDALIRYFVPEEVARRHVITLVDIQNRTLASTVSAGSVDEKTNSHSTSIIHEAPITPPGNGLMLRGQAYRTSIDLVGNALFWVAAILSALTLWMLWGGWRHQRRRNEMQKTLVSEANFRRAMENSMLTGMRAMDMEGRITYINPAFCAMTGFSEMDLIGRLPPFPHWPPDRLEENSRLLQEELQGRSPAGGIEVKVMRKDGSLFDARMYVSPLIDPRGQQTGWMTSMTNITDAKRIRDQLSAAHERFTTVLEGLDAAVSVVSVHQGELLFANRSYRLWFDADPQGHSQLAGGESPLPAESDESVEQFGGLPTQQITDAEPDSREVFIDSLSKWFEVRARYLQWTDGRLAQMLIATDITARRKADALAAAQAEKAQVTSRLMTMGEMASSVAHELNQPLTAITNYCNGMVSRVRNNAITQEDLIAALEKTSRQAQRAGQIIHRIRAFVKRSEPQRQPSTARQIVDDAAELAGFELRRRNVSIQTYVAPQLPHLMVDPILIEQVVLNLVKNAAEAIDEAKLPLSRRHIELKVIEKRSADEGHVVAFSITDMGPGLKPEVLSRLYEAFFSTKADGLGIGLSLCRSIIESHQGRIRAENLYNETWIVGCRFSFTLPVLAAEPLVSWQA